MEKIIHINAGKIMYKIHSLILLPVFIKVFLFPLLELCITSNYDIKKHEKE